MEGLFGGLHTVLGDVYVVNTQLRTIEDAFPNITTIGGRLFVHSNDDIANCSERGFKNLASLDGTEARQPTNIDESLDLRPHLYVETHRCRANLCRGAYRRSSYTSWCELC